MKGLEVSLGRFFQDLLVQGKIGNRSLQPCVLLLELLESFRLIEVDSTVITSPPIISVIGDTDLSYYLTDALTARNGDEFFAGACSRPAPDYDLFLAFLPPFILCII